jgi:hypothetical protein
MFLRNFGTTVQAYMMSFTQLLLATNYKLHVLTMCFVCVCVWGGYEGLVRRMHARVLVWAPRDICLMVMSYQVLSLFCCVMVAQLADNN